MSTSWPRRRRDSSLWIPVSPRAFCYTSRVLLGTFVSFFVRAQNNVNHHVHPCRSSFTIKQAYDTCFRRADLPKLGRGDAGATWIVS